MKRTRSSCLVRFILYIFVVLLIENIVFIARWTEHQPSPAVGLLSETGLPGEAVYRSRRLLPILLKATRSTVDGKARPTATGHGGLETTTSARSTSRTKESEGFEEDKSLEEEFHRLGELFGPIINPAKARLTEKAFYSRRSSKVNPYLYDIVLKPNETCDNDTFVVILIHTHHFNTMQRTAIRHTWGSVASLHPENATWPRVPPLKRRLRLFFVLGVHNISGLNQLVRKEASRFDDVVQGNFMDSYENMTLKSLLGLKFVSEYCRPAKYLLKSDDDMFVNLPYLVDILARTPHRRSIMGPLNIGSQVMRNGKWKLTYDQFPFAHFPPYESGAAYVITADVVKELYDTAEYVPHIFIDDVYITGILGRILDISHVRQAGFAHWSSAVPGVCDFVRNRVITGTGMTPFRLEGIWSEMQFNKC